MISALHLLWIIPLSTIFGFCIAELLSANGNDDDYIGNDGC